MPFDSLQKSTGYPDIAQVDRSEHSGEDPLDGWEARPWLARALRLSLTLLPFVGALGVSYLLSDAWSRPEGWAVILWLVSITLISFGTMILLDRLTRRFVPLTVLLRMTLVFPDKAPSRFAVALRSASTKELDRVVDEVKADGLGGTADEAAENLLLMVSALTRHDRLTRGHSERTRAYTDLIATEMGLSKVDRSKLRWAALLHDVGKVYVPARILNRSGKLTAREFEIVKQHPEHGARMIAPLREWLGEWADTVGQHHERWDGAGYPAGISSTAISRGARIVAVADTFDVITSIRTYKKAQSARFARAEIAANSGTQFDPDVVRAFLRVGLGRFRVEMGPLTLLAQLPALRFLLDAGRVASTVTTSGTGLAAPAAAAAVAVTGLVAPVHPGAVNLPELAFVEPQSSTAETAASAAPLETFRMSETTSTTMATVVTSMTSTPRTSLPVSTSSPPVESPALSTTTTSTSTTTTTVSPPPVTAGPQWPSGIQAIADCLGEPADPDAWRARGILDLRTCNFDGLDFADSNLSSIHYRGGTWVGADFPRANLDDATFSSANLDRADFSDAEMAGAHFVDFTAVGAQFDATSATSPTLGAVRFENGTLDTASFAGRRIVDLVVDTNVSAVETDFSGARMTGSTLTGIDLTGSSFLLIDSRGNDFRATTLIDVTFVDSLLRGTDFDQSTLTRTSFARADVRGASFVSAAVDTVTFKSAVGQLKLGESVMNGPVTCPDGQTYTSPPATGSLCG